MIWNGNSLSKALGVQVAENIIANQVQFNSRDTQVGDLFIALSSNRDGHKYVKDALDRGAAAVIISEDNLTLPKDKIIRVQDTTEALLKLAKYKRAASKAKFIGITGSVGKTSTKEALHKMLTPFGKIFCSRGNFNNYLGVQINLASLSDDTEYAVFEMGMNHQGEILQLAELVKPDIAVITNISEAHMEFFVSIGEIVEAKCEILAGLSKSNGVTIIPAFDEKIYKQIQQLAKGYHVKQIYSFGRKNNSNAYITTYQLQVNKVLLKYNIDNELVEFEMPVISQYQCENFAACFVVIKALGLNIQSAVKGLKKFELIYGRGKILRLHKNGKVFHIISEQYNASPASMKAALQHFASIEHPQKILILGDMKELGVKSDELHQSLILPILNTNAYKILLVGTAMQNVASQFAQGVFFRHFDHTEQLISALPDILDNKELILLKASNSMGFEKVVDYFNKTP